MISTLLNPKSNIYIIFFIGSRNSPLGAKKFTSMIQVMYFKNKKSVDKIFQK